MIGPKMLGKGIRSAQEVYQPCGTPQSLRKPLRKPLRRKHNYNSVTKWASYSAQSINYELEFIAYMLLYFSQGTLNFYLTFNPTALRISLPVIFNLCFLHSGFGN